MRVLLTIWLAPPRIFERCAKPQLLDDVDVAARSVAAAAKVSSAQYWVKRTDGVSGHQFWANRATRETTWVRPPGLDAASSGGTTAPGESRSAAATATSAIPTAVAKLERLSRAPPTAPAAKVHVNRHGSVDIRVSAACAGTTSEAANAAHPFRFRYTMPAIVRTRAPPRSPGPTPSAARSARDELSASSRSAPRAQVYVQRNECVDVANGADSAVAPRAAVPTPSAPPAHPARVVATRRVAAAFSSSSFAMVSATTRMSADVQVAELFATNSLLLSKLANDVPY